MPNYSVNSALIVILVVACFYGGIFIKILLWPGEYTQPLWKQVLINLIPLFLVVAAFSPIVERTVSDWSLFLVLGLIMEQGAIGKYFRDIVDKLRQK